MRDNDECFLTTVAPKMNKFGPFLKRHFFHLESGIWVFHEWQRNICNISHDCSKVYTTYAVSQYLLITVAPKMGEFGPFFLAEKPNSLRGAAFECSITEWECWKTFLASFPMLARGFTLLWRWHEVSFSGVDVLAPLVTVSILIQAKNMKGLLLITINWEAIPYKLKTCLPLMQTAFSSLSITGVIGTF